MRISIPVVFVTAAGDLRRNILEDRKKIFDRKKRIIFHGVKIFEEKKLAIAQFNWFSLT